MIYRGDLRAQTDPENFRKLMPKISAIRIRAVVRVDQGPDGATPDLDIDCGPRIPGKFSAASGFGRKRGTMRLDALPHFVKAIGRLRRQCSELPAPRMRAHTGRVGTSLGETPRRLSDSSSFAGSAGATSTGVGARATDSARD